jgi:hypothetical protein
MPIQGPVLEERYAIANATNKAITSNNLHFLWLNSAVTVDPALQGKQEAQGI